MMSSTSVDPSEVERFSALAHEWWDPKGKFRPLHQINPLRLGFVRDEVCDRFARDSKSASVFSGLSVLDIGCGGGLLCEPLARLGGDVLGADASSANIDVARLHAERNELPITYRVATAEQLAEAGEAFDVVVALEIVEHVPNVPAFVASCASMVRPGGMMVISTINRTVRAYVLAIVGAEYVLRWLPRGTHRFRKLVTPGELSAAFDAAGLEPGRTAGMVFNPLRGEWTLDATDTSVNYLMAAHPPRPVAPL